MMKNRFIFLLVSLIGAFPVTTQASSLENIVATILVCGVSGKILQKNMKDALDSKKIYESLIEKKKKEQAALFESFVSSEQSAAVFSACGAALFFSVTGLLVQREQQAQNASLATGAFLSAVACVGHVVAHKSFTSGKKFIKFTSKSDKSANQKNMKTICDARKLYKKNI
jgi:hypothetical protein